MGDCAYNMTLFVLALPPYEMRYTVQWAKWFDECLKKNKIDYEIINGTVLQNSLSGKSFLNIRDTMYWRSTQMAELASKVKIGDTVFSMDGEFLTLDAMAYLSNMELNHTLNLYSFWHAGTYDTYDMTFYSDCEYFASHLEKGQMNLCKKIFVGSEWHKQLITNTRRRNGVYTSISNIGVPVDVEGLHQRGMKTKDKSGIVFTGRLADEKGYLIIKSLRAKGFDIFCTQEHMLPKEEYYDVLCKSKIVLAPSEQETFGIGVVEAIACGCIPIVPNRLSFLDYVPLEYRYDMNSSIAGMIGTFNSKEVDEQLYVGIQKYQYGNVIKNLLHEMCLL